MGDALERVSRILRTAPLIDGHNDLPWEQRDARRKHPGEGPAPLDLSHRVTGVMTDLPRLEEGCVGAQFWSVFVASDLPRDEAVIQSLEQVDTVYAMVRRYPDHWNWIHRRWKTRPPGEQRFY